MKLQQSLICAIVVGISSGTTFSSCQSSGLKKQPDKVQTNKTSGNKTQTTKKDPCPTCGMG